MNDSLTFLAELEEIIQQRIDSPSPDSYTATLVASGAMRVAQKVGEEGVELALAALAGTAEQQLDEAADLIFHVLVLLRSKGMGLSDVAERLRARHASDRR